jgi:hypothetical protein
MKNTAQTFIYKVFSVAFLGVVFGGVTAYLGVKGSMGPDPE